MPRKSKKFLTLEMQLLLIEAAITRFEEKISERLDIEDPFMVNYMNCSNDFNNLFWRKSIILQNIHNI